MKTSTYSLFLLLALLGLLAFVLDISLGQVAIPFKEVVKSLLGLESQKETWHYIIVHFRLPKAIVAVLAGIGLSLSGLLMQTLFRNPLAGPYVLGLSSGSSLGVAFIVLGSGFLPVFAKEILLSPYGIVIASCLGSLVVLLTVLLVSKKLRDTMTLLVIGLMFSSFTNAIVSVLSYFASAEELQKFTFWSMGSIGNVSWSNITLLSVVLLLGLVIGIATLKPLDALLLGENYARSMGVTIKKSRFLIIIATSILAGGVTAFVGPIAFIGLAVPHLAKILLQTSHHKLLFLVQ